MTDERPKKLPVYCLKCGAFASADSDIDEPFCEAHITRCQKCGAQAQADTWPPLCTQCMANKGGGNIREPKKKEE